MRTVKEIFSSHAQLDATGRHVGGTDKESNHRYGDAYEGILETLYPLEYSSKRISGRASVDLMMEVGVADGSSLLAWRDALPNAHCVALDIHPAAQLIDLLNIGINRVEFHLGNQRSKEDCERAARGRLFDLIIEDATHRLEDNLLTLLYLWPYVRRGGLYIIEEFANVGALRCNIAAMWPTARIVDTVGPSGGIEPLVVLRKAV